MAASRPEVNVVVVDDYTDAVSAQFVIKKDAEKIYFSGNRQNFDLFLVEIEKFLRHPMHSLIKDLYRIAATVYISDLRIKRSDKIGSRGISILISVSDKSKWDSEKQHLESTLRFLSGDIFTFHFVQGERTAVDFEFKGDKENRRNEIHRETGVLLIYLKASTLKILAQWACGINDPAIKQAIDIGEIFSKVNELEVEEKTIQEYIKIFDAEWKKRY